MHSNKERGKTSYLARFSEGKNGDQEKGKVKVLEYN